MVPIDGAATDDLCALTDADITDGMALVVEAGWNQTAADWRYMLSAGRGFGLRDAEGRLIASSTVLPYRPGIGWIGMVLVSGTHRRRGHGTRLLHNAIAHCRSEGLTPMLDATPAGRAVYLGLGFSGSEVIERWRGVGGGCNDASEGAIDIQLARQLDAEAFGADRGGLIDDLSQRVGAPCRQLDEGILLGRRGRTATQLGPLLSRDPGNASLLCACAIDAVAGPLLIDVPLRQEGLRSVLREHGFSVERSFTRMSLDAPVTISETMAAIAGPELG